MGIWKSALQLQDQGILGDMHKKPNFLWQQRPGANSSGLLLRLSRKESLEGIIIKLPIGTLPILAFLISELCLRCTHFQLFLAFRSVPPILSCPTRPILFPGLAQPHFPSSFCSLELPFSYQENIRSFSRMPCLKSNFLFLSFAALSKVLPHTFKPFIISLCPQRKTVTVDAGIGWKVELEKYLPKTKQNRESC